MLCCDLLLHRDARCAAPAKIVMSEHAKLAPSAAHRWMRCPGSVALCKDLPDTDSEYAQEGTFAHEIAAHLLLTQREAKSAIGISVLQFTCDEVMAAHIQTYLDVVRTLELLEGGTLFVEQRLQIYGADVWGTADALIWSADGQRLHVCDLKYGSGVLVSAHHNEQMMLYALGALKVVEQVQEVHLHIVQPRRPDANDVVHRIEVLSRSFFQAFENEVATRVSMTAAEDAALVPGEHCRFCPAQTTCPALREYSLDAAKDAFGVPECPPTPKSLSAQQVGRLLSAADTIEVWLRAVREHAMGLARQGIPVPGWKLVQRLGNRRWTDPAAVAAELQAAGIDPYLPRELLSPAQVEKRLGKSARATVDRLAVRPVTGVQLTTEDDKRPALDFKTIFFESRPLEDAGPQV